MENNILRQYVLNLSFDDLLKIIKDFEQLERDGFIDDCNLRKAAQDFRDKYGLPGSQIILWMDRIAHDCYRIIAEKALEEGFKF